MRYIRIDRRSLEAEVVGAKGKGAIFVPIRKDRSGSAFRDMLHYTVYFDVLYPLIEARDQKRGVHIGYKLTEPDPWLIALAAIMWEGLVQGLTWDIIKFMCLSALDKLRQKHLAPRSTPARKRQARTRANRVSQTEVGFSWTKFGGDGRPLYEFFLGVKRRFRKSTDEEKVELSTASHMIRKPKKA